LNWPRRWGNSLSRPEKRLFEPQRRKERKGKQRLRIGRNGKDRERKRQKRLNRKDAKNAKESKDKGLGETAKTKAVHGCVVAVNLSSDLFSASFASLRFNRLAFAVVVAVTQS
jgi:hypothetical protein